jgi:hypothetical protein
LYDLNRFLDVVVRLVDVFKCALLEALGEGIVFFLGNVVVSFVHEFKRTVETAAPVEASINRKMIVDIFAVVDGSFLDFVDGFIDFVYSLLFLITQFSAIRTLQMGACMTEIRQSVKISGMLSRRLRLCRNERRNEEQESEKNEHQFVRAFHRAYGSYPNEIELQKYPFG